MFKRLLSIIFVLALLINNVAALEADVFVQSTVNRASKLLSDNISKEEKIEKLKLIAKDTVDIEGIGFYTLGAVRKNLNDVQKKEYAKKFIKKLNYKNRNSYDHSNEHKYENFLFKNTGEAGEVLICNTTELLHRAGNPIERNHRDMISLHFVAWPTKQKISKFEFKDMIFDDRMIKDFSKIKGIRNLIKYYNKNLMYKLKTN